MKDYTTLQVSKQMAKALKIIKNSPEYRETFKRADQILESMLDQFQPNWRELIDNNVKEETVSSQANA